MYEGRILEETKPAAPSPKQRAAVAGFGFLFAVCLIGGVIASLRWSGAMSLTRWIHAGQFLVGGSLSGVFLLTAKKVSREANQKRSIALLLIVWLPQLIVDVFLS